MEGLIYSDLSYNLVGLVYNVYNNLGFGYQEKYYQRAYARELEKLGLKFRREQKCVINYQGKQIGRYFIDFVVDGKVVVEFKVANDFYLQYTKQVLGYLKATGLRLGILFLFTKNGIKYKRIVN